MLHRFRQFVYYLTCDINSIEHFATVYTIKLPFALLFLIVQI